LKRLPWLAIAALLWGAGCNNNCYNLAKVVCQCGATANGIAVCNSVVAVQNGIAKPTQEDLDRCGELLKVCDCRLLGAQTLQAKVACGLARDNPRDQALSPTP
jgi:hypothetical protein